MLSAYEQKRADNIKANDAVLASLGIEPLCRPPKITLPRPTKVAKVPRPAERHQPPRGPQQATVDQLDDLLDVATKGLEEAASQTEVDQHKEWIGSIKECMTGSPQPSDDEAEESDSKWQEFLQNIRDGISSPSYSPTDDEDSIEDSTSSIEIGTKDVVHHKRPRGRGRKGQTWSTETGKWEQDEPAEDEPADDEEEEYVPEDPTPPPKVKAVEDDDISQYIRTHVKYKKTVPMCPLGCGIEMKNRKGHGKRWFKQELRNVYKYECLECGLQYTNFPGASMDTAALCSSSMVTFAGVLNPNRICKEKRIQKCSQCGQPRKGHICVV